MPPPKSHWRAFQRRVLPFALAGCTGSHGAQSDTSVAPSAVWVEFGDEFPDELGPAAEGGVYFVGDHRIGLIRDGVVTTVEPIDWATRASSLRSGGGLFHQPAPPFGDVQKGFGAFLLSRPKGADGPDIELQAVPVGGGAPTTHAGAQLPGAQWMADARQFDTDSNQLFVNSTFQVLLSDSLIHDRGVFGRFDASWKWTTIADTAQGVTPTGVDLTPRILIGKSGEVFWIARRSVQSVQLGSGATRLVADLSWLTDEESPEVEMVRLGDSLGFVASHGHPGDLFLLPQESVGATKDNFTRLSVFPSVGPTDCPIGLAGFFCPWIILKADNLNLYLASGSQLKRMRISDGTISDMSPDIGDESANQHVSKLIVDIALDETHVYGVVLRDEKTSGDDKLNWKVFSVRK